MYSELATTISSVINTTISENRKQVVQPLIDFIQNKIDHDSDIHLNFICTHNSRRSQFSQIWANTAARYYNIPVNCYSGGVEVTAFNPRAVASIQRSGFKIKYKEQSNPEYHIYTGDNTEPIIAFSKLFDHPMNKSDQFAAVMTCSHADENCPFIPGTERRIVVRYDDPKEFDDTPLEATKYDERSLQIASEMFYAFSKVKKR